MNNGDLNNPTRDSESMDIADLILQNSADRTRIELLNRIVQTTEEVYSRNPDYEGEGPRRESGNTSPASSEKSAADSVFDDLD